jgi:hypothetical protein
MNAKKRHNMKGRILSANVSLATDESAPPTLIKSEKNKDIPINTGDAAPVNVTGLEANSHALKPFTFTFIFPFISLIYLFNIRRDTDSVKVKQESGSADKHWSIINFHKVKI